MNTKRPASDRRPFRVYRWTTGLCMLFGMISTRRLLSFLLMSVFAVLLSGCGATLARTEPPPMTTPATSPLAGNWLLYGAIPPVITTAPIATGTSSIVAEFDVVGSTVTASATIRAGCSTPGSAGNLQGSVGANFGATLVGTIAADGSFSVSFPLNQNPQLTSLTIQGTAPKAADAPWTGSYTFSFTSLLGNGCNLNASGPFTATSIADVDGAFTGTGSVTVSPGLSKVPLTLDLVLQQGGQLYALNGAAPVTSRLALNGSIQVQGISCFSKGTSTLGRPSLVDGSEIDTSFTMDDGSTLQVHADMVDSGVTQLAVTNLVVLGGQCAGEYLSIPGLQLQR